MSVRHLASLSHLKELLLARESQNAEHNIGTTRQVGEQRLHKVLELSVESGPSLFLAEDFAVRVGVPPISQMRVPKRS